MKERRSGLMQSIQRAQALLLPLLCTRFRHTHSIARRQETHGLWKSHVFVLHQKAKDVATGVAAKEIKKPLSGAYCERRCFLLMKWAQPFSIGTSALELDIVANHIDNIRTEQDFLNNLFRNELIHESILRVQQWSYRHRHRRPENAVPVDDAPGLRESPGATAHSRRPAQYGPGKTLRG